VEQGLLAPPNSDPGEVAICEFNSGFDEGAFYGGKRHLIGMNWPGPCFESLYCGEGKLRRTGKLRLLPSQSEAALNNQPASRWF
jgi:hypothetical protein